MRCKCPLMTQGGHRGTPQLAVPDIGPVSFSVLVLSVLALSQASEQLSMELIPNIERLTQIFSNAVAPSFFLGAIAGFVSLMMSRLTAVNERIKATRALSNQDRNAVGNSMALGSFKRRARLLSDGIILSLCGGVCATLLLCSPFREPVFWPASCLWRGRSVFYRYVALGTCAGSVRPGSMACTPRMGGIAINSPSGAAKFDECWLRAREFASGTKQAWGCVASLSALEVKRASSAPKGYVCF